MCTSYIALFFPIQCHEFSCHMVMVVLSLIGHNMVRAFV